jgi:hypothetical protein
MVVGRRMARKTREIFPLTVAVGKHFWSLRPSQSVASVSVLKGNFNVPMQASKEEKISSSRLKYFEELSGLGTCL